MNLKRKCKPKPKPWALGLILLSLSASARDLSPLCAYFGASYEHANSAPNVLAYQPIGYYLPTFLGLAGIGLINYSIPGASAEVLNQQYEVFKSSDNDPGRQVKTECLIIGVTGQALFDPSGILAFSLRVANENKDKVVFALSYPRTNLYSADTLNNLQVPPGWNLMANEYDRIMTQVGAVVLKPFLASKPRVCLSDCRDPAWTYDAFHLSNDSYIAAAAIIAAGVITQLEP